MKRAPPPCFRRGSFDAYVPICDRRNQKYLLDAVSTSIYFRPLNAFSVEGRAVQSRDPVGVGFIRLLIHKSQVAGAGTACRAYISRVRVLGYPRPNARKAREIGCFRPHGRLCQFIPDCLRGVSRRIVRAGGLSDCGCAAHSRWNGLVALRNCGALWSATEVQEIDRHGRIVHPLK